MPAKTSTASPVKFAIRTRDQAWIARNGATVRDDGWVLFDAPASAIEVVTFCGNDHLRYMLPDVPRDFGNRWAMCPAVYVPETAKTLGASIRLTAATLARQAEVEEWKASAGA